jgi:hypothetical protein
MPPTPEKAAHPHCFQQKNVTVYRPRPVTFVMYKKPQQAYF